MISAVVVTHDSAACVAACLASLQDALPCAEIVVVDNRSRDETLPVVRATAPHARVIANADNLGFGRACNTGAAAARGSHVLFLNPDVVLTAIQRDRIPELLAAEPFGLVAPALEGETDRRRAERSWRGEYLAQTFETIRPREWRRRAGRCRPSKRTWVSGAMLLVSRDEFLSIGGFDSRFFLYYEDLDLSRRYRDVSLPIRTTEALTGRHTVGTSSPSDGLRAGPMAWSFLGWIQYMCIHDDERSARRAARATLTTLRVLRFTTHALAVFRSARAQRKSRQIDEFLRLVAEQASRGDTRFCPDALRLVRGLA